MLAIAALTPGARAHDPGYIVHNLGTLPGATTTIATAVNNKGQVTGYCWYPDTSRWHGFLWEAGSMTDLGPALPDTSFLAAGINDHSQVAGWMIDHTTELEQAAVWANGVFTPVIEHPAAQRSFANDINNAREVVGSAVVPSLGKELPYLWSNGTARKLALPDAMVSGQAVGLSETGDIAGAGWDPTTQTWTAIAWVGPNHTPRNLGSLAANGSSKATAVSDIGSVTGWTDVDDANPAAFLYRDGLMTALPSLGGSSAHGNAINEADEVVGAAWHEGSQDWHATAWRLGVISNLNGILVPGSEWDSLTEATDISDIGEIIGYGRHESGDIQSFLLEPLLTLTTPIPGNSGEVNTFDCAGATPGNEVIFVYGFNWGTFDVPNCPGAVFDIQTPALLDSAIADARGHAVFDKLVPSQAKYKVVIFQAWEPATCDVATAVMWTFY